MKISVIIPTYNRWPLVCRAIDSVLAQSRPADQVIVVDDGSTDDSVRQLLQHYSHRINVLQQANSGVSAARNNGIQQATGDWIALLDSDDEWLPEKLSHQERIIAEQRDAVLCHTDEIWIRNGIRVNPMKKHSKHGGNIFLNCLPLCAISPSSALIKKETLTKVGMFDESLPACEDYDLWLRICSRHEVLFIPEAQLIKYGGHDDQLSRKYWGMDRFRIQALKKLLDSETLSNIQRDHTIQMLVKKTRILHKGACKHRNVELAEYCNTLLQQYRNSSPETDNPC
ncbi:glycosyl transferase [Chromatiales bacterium (ex Bugula neritina AB1)]|nr:glycosyl transferase [Chromatiales bacterium (ex Bugula neritina AB1)]